MSTTTATEQPPASVTAPGTGQARARAVARRLALVEGRRQLTHPFVWLGLALAMASFLNAQRYVPVLHRDVPPLANYSLPLIVGVLLTAYLAASRPARHETEELFQPAPTSRPTRTLGLLLSLPWALLVGAIWTALAIAVLYAKGGVGVPFTADVAARPARHVRSRRRYRTRRLATEACPGRRGVVDARRCPAAAHPGRRRRGPHVRPPTRGQRLAAARDHDPPRRLARRLPRRAHRTDRGDRPGSRRGDAAPRGSCTLRVRDRRLRSRRAARSQAHVRRARRAAGLRREPTTRV